MFKKCFVAAAILMASPAFVSAQDIFWSFSPTELITTSSVGVDDLTGSAYIFSDGQFGFDILDLDFTTSASDVVRFTGGEVFNPTFDVIGRTRFDSGEITVDAEGSSGNLFLVAIIERGVNPTISSLFDPGFDAGVGPNGAVLLARVDFELIGNGAADLKFSLGPQGAVELPALQLNPSFGSATFTLAKLGFCLGDVNLSGTVENNFTDGVDFFDIAPFIAVLTSGQYQFEADCNLDGVADFADIAPFIEILAGA